MAERSRGGPWLMGIDVGGTKVATLLTDAAFQVRAARTAPTDLTSPERTLESIAQVVEATLDDAGAAPSELAAVGMGVPGLVSPEEGTVDLAVNLGWRNVSAGPWLAERLGVPCFIENDVRAATAGILRFGLAGGARSLAYLAIGTGVSAGLVIDGLLHRGVHGMAGEIGHVQADPHGALCGCGARGCLETIVAGPAIAQRAELALQANGVHSALPPRPSATQVLEAAAAGDELAAGVVQQVCRHLARALYHLALAYDVEAIVLGGGVAAAGQALLQPLRAAVAELHAETQLARAVLPFEAIRLLPPDAQAGGWGGVAVAEAGLARRSPHPTLSRVRERDQE